MTKTFQAPGNWSGVPESPVGKDEPEFKVDLRFAGIAQDVILKDEQRIGKIQEVVGKLRNGSRTKSILEDLGNPENPVKFSADSNRIFHEMGKIELYELGKISRTVQCHSCLKHIQERLTFCSCGVCLRPDEETIQTISARVQALMVPYYLARVNRSRARSTARLSGNKTIGKQWMPEEEHGNTMRAPSQSGGKRMKTYRNSQQTPTDGLNTSPTPGRPHDDRHLLYRIQAPEAPVREHHHVGVQR